MRKRTAPPLPATLPGRFFLLARDRAHDRFLLYVDDEARSSYDLGSDVAVLMQRFRTWGIPDLGNRCIDGAIEFGAAQGIPAEDRMVLVYDRPAKPQLKFSDEDSNAPAVYFPTF